MAKHTRMLLLAAALLLGTLALASRGIDPIALVGGSILILFLAYALVGGPKKHKDFSYSDQLRGMLQSYGGNPPPEIKPPEGLDEDRIQKLPSHRLGGKHSKEQDGTRNSWD